MYACGTIRKDRIPRSFVSSAAEERQTERGEHDWVSQGPLLLTKWKDNKMVYHLSTIHTPTTDKIERKLKDGTSTVVSCPGTLVDYQQNMRGVDRSDQMISLYNVGRKSRKW